MEINNLTPLDNRLLCKLVERKEERVGRIIVPGNIEQRQHIADVIAIGKNCKHVAVGDRVFFGKYSGHDIKDYTDDFIMLKEEEVLAVIQK